MQGVLLLTLVDVLLTEVVILSGKHRTTQTWVVNGDGPISPIIEPSAGGASPECSVRVISTNISLEFSLLLSCQSTDVAFIS